MVQKYNFQILVLHNSKEDDCKLFIICFKQIMQIIPRKKLVLIKSFWARNASSPTHTAGFAACVRETLRAGERTESLETRHPSQLLEPTLKNLE